MLAIVPAYSWECSKVWYTRIYTEIEINIRFLCVLYVWKIKLYIPNLVLTWKYYQQIFYSFGLACGSLVTLSSYSNFYNNCHFDAVFVSVANFFTSIYAGFVIFSVLGFQAHSMGVSVDGKYFFKYFPFFGDIGFFGVFPKSIKYISLF